MKYEYIRITLCESYERFAARHFEATTSVEGRINQLGEAGWRLIHSENDGVQLTFALMERVTEGATNEQE